MTTSITLVSLGVFIPRERVDNYYYNIIYQPITLHPNHLLSARHQVVGLLILAQTRSACAIRILKKKNVSFPLSAVDR